MPTEVVYYFALKYKDEVTVKLILYVIKNDKITVI